jgi:hypothetical protein
VPQTQRLRPRHPGTVLIRVEPTDRLLADSIPVASSCLKATGQSTSFLERYLEEALVSAFETIAPNAAVEMTGHGRVELPSWDRKLGGFDLTIHPNPDSRQIALLEAKVDDVDQMLWDIHKLASGLELTNVSCAYMVVAREEHKWSEGDCAELFAELSGPRRWGSIQMFERWSGAWRSALSGGSARPTSVQAELETEFLGRARVDAFPSYEIRCAAVRLVDGSGTLAFDGDWPAPLTG